MLAGWFAFQFLRNDDKSTREGLIKSGQYNLLGGMITSAVMIVSSIGILNNSYSSLETVPTAVGAALGLCLSYYWLTVYRRYAEMI